MLEPLCYFILEKSIPVFSVIFFLFCSSVLFLYHSIVLCETLFATLSSPTWSSLRYCLPFSSAFLFLFPSTVLCRAIFAAFSGKYYPLFNIVFVSVLSYFSYHFALKNPFCNSYLVNFNPEALFNIVLLSFFLYPFLMFPFTVL